MSGATDTTSTWSSGDAYEAYVGRWSALVAPRFLDALAVEPDRRWLDVGAGTGITTQAILERAAPASVIGVDPSEPFVQHARRVVRDPRATFRIGTATDTGVADDAIDAVIFGLVLNQLPDAVAALAEARRVTVPGGVIAAYVWDYAEGMQFIRAFWDAAIALDPEAAAHDQARRFPIAAPEPLRAAFT
jgi:ubiquinone/menaquinone biosynthesis C-methylase UbiE